jgi:CCR4-NOT transcription complex subunit 1
VDLLPEISQPPRVLSNVSHALEQAGLRADIDGYLKHRAPYTVLLELHHRLLSTDGDGRQRYNVSLLNSLVLHVGTQVRRAGLATCPPAWLPGCLLGSLATTGWPQGGQPACRSVLSACCL